jgi:ATP-dependent Lon protease
VLPIGGLKEKALGAVRAGIKAVIIPKKNVKDLVEIPHNLKRRLKFIPVKTMEEVLENALEPSKNDKSRSREKGAQR